MNVSQLRGFLLQLPKPHVVRVTGEGEPQELKVGRSYAKLADTIAALNVELVECLDKDGTVLRAKRLDSAEAHRSDAAEIPEALKQDPHVAMLTHFANLIHRAYEHSTETAFVRLVEIVDKMGDRSDAIEQRLERTESTNRRLLQQQVDDALDRAEEVAERAAAGAEGGGGFVEQMAAGFLSGKQQAAARPTNGKGQG